MRVISVCSASNSAVQGGLRVGVLRAVVVLDRQVVHALQHGVHLGQGAFSGLHDGDAVLGVADGDLEATDLRAQALGDREAGSVVRSAVDAEAAGELLEGLGHLVLRDGQVAVRVDRRDVLVDPKTHGDVPPG